MLRNNLTVNREVKNILNIFDRLREERERMGFSQQGIADVLGVTKQTQFQYEKGNNSPKADYLAKLSQIGADVQYILTGERTVEVISDAEATLLAALRAAPVALQHAALAAAHGVLASAPTSTVTIQGDVGVQVSGGTQSFGNIQVGKK